MAYASYEQQEWSATYILFIIWALVSLAAPVFTRSRHPRASQQMESGTPVQGTYTQQHFRSDPLVMNAAADGNARKMSQLFRVTQTGFLLLFASTIAHALIPLSGHTGTNAVLTWIAFAFLIVWYTVTSAGYGESSVYELTLMIPAVILSIINFGLAFGGI
ncbi:hypothetical protein HDU78_006127 [Chytriomyces hyalinus]|nr:hypothetical protein HDU78_006127 [Chytriomyces hyalinus]KAJ3264919.1 hypothetical protein HDU77_007199 [Chytriomyces hyalinus]